VYPRRGPKKSQLVWAFDNNPVLNLGAAVNPLDWLALGIRARFNIGDDSKMDDYDWLPSCPNYFCHSWPLHGA
jgi:outer membrane protease